MTVPPASAKTEAITTADPSPYSFNEKVRRMLWAAVQATIFRYSFRTWDRWRCMLLRAFGAKVHPTCHIRRTAVFECPWNLTMEEHASAGDHAILYCLGQVRIGARTTVSQGAHICAGSHDYTSRRMVLLRPAIRIGNDCWIAAEAFVGPAVTIGDGAILGARGVTFRDLEPWTIYVGNPAKPVRKRPPLDG
jgi:putative colanic acid biosynthesis acetyltransferase WcaF